MIKYSYVRLVTFVTLLAFAGAANAQVCSKSRGTMEYCKCTYEEALDRIMDSQGTSRSSMKQRIEALAKALKKCLDGGTDEVITEMQSI